MKKQLKPFVNPEVVQEEATEVFKAICHLIRSNLKMKSMTFTVNSKGKTENVVIEV